MATKEDVEAAAHGTLLWDRGLYKALVETLEARRVFEGASEEYRHGEALWLLDCALDLAAMIAGKDALALIYGDDPAEDAPQADQLLAIHRRLRPLRELFSGVEGVNRDSASSLNTLADELAALANGDRSKLLREAKGTQGKPVNSWRLAQRQIAALEWEAYLRAMGQSPAEAQNFVASAFIQTWETIKKWRKPIINELGQDQYDRAIKQAQRGFGYYSRVSRRVSAEVGIRKDADAFKRERRRSLELVG